MLNKSIVILPGQVSSNSIKSFVYFIYLHKAIICFCVVELFIVDDFKNEVRKIDCCSPTTQPVVSLMKKISFRAFLQFRVSRTQVTPASTVVNIVPSLPHTHPMFLFKK